MTTTPIDPKLPLAGRLVLAGLGAVALALVGAGLAYAGSSADSGDSAWVTVVEDDASGKSTSGSSTDCPWRQSSAGDGL
jgi:hypothetical protein